MQTPARYLVVIESSGSSTALMFTADRHQVAEFDAGSEEVAVMTRHLSPSSDADAPEWNAALAGSSAAERRAALVYTLDV